MQYRKQWVGEGKALNVSGLRRAPWKITVPKWDWVYNKISSVRSIQRRLRGCGQKKMHSSDIYKGYALYKIDVKNTLQQQNSMWCQFATNVFSEFLLLLFRDMLLIFLLYVFSKHVYICVPSSCLFVGLFCFLYIFTQFVGVFLSLSLT